MNLTQEESQNKVIELTREIERLQSELRKAQKEIANLERQKYKGLYGADS